MVTGNNCHETTLLRGLTIEDEGRTCGFFRHGFLWGDLSFERQLEVSDREVLGFIPRELGWRVLMVSALDKGGLGEWDMISTTF